jgi:hypothetical protein
LRLSQGSGAGSGANDAAVAAVASVADLADAVDVAAAAPDDDDDDDGGDDDDDGGDDDDDGGDDDDDGGDDGDVHPWPHAPIYGALGAIGFLVILALASPWVRRRSFEVFYFSHHVLVVPVALAILHVRTLLLYGAPAVVLLLLDKVLRFFRGRRTWTVVRVACSPSQPAHVLDGRKMPKPGANGRERRRGPVAARFVLFCQRCCRIWAAVASG